MRAIPSVPIDGEQYVGPWMGVPHVLEYDGPTGGYKLVVTTETGVAINISGTVEITGGQVTAIGGGNYGEDTPHVSGQTGTFVMGVRSNLPTALAADGDYIPFIVDSLGRLHTATTMASGSFPGQDGAQPLADATANPYAGLIGALGLGWDPVASDWNRVRVEANQGALFVSLGSGTMPGQGTVFSMGGSAISSLTRAGMVGSFNYLHDSVSDSWNRVQSFDANVDSISPRAQRTLTFGYGYDDASFDWNRLRSKLEAGLYTTMISGSFPGQAQAVEIDDTIAGALRAGIVGGANLMYDVVGGNWERDPARVVLADGMAAGVFPQRIAFGMHQSYATASWDANFGDDATADGVEASESLKNAINVRSILYARDGATTFDRLIGPRESGLNVSLISGSFPGQATAQLMGDAIVNPYAGLVGSLNLMYDVAGDNWERDPARIPGDAMVQAVFPQRVSFGVHFNYAAGAWERHYGGDVSADGIVGNLGGAALDNSLNVRSVLLLNDGSFVYDTAHGSRERGLHTSMISGSFPGQDGAQLMSDDMANPYAGLVGALSMGFNPPSGTWDRLLVDDEGRLQTRAFVTGTVALSAVDIEIGAVELKDGATDDRQRVTADGRAWVSALITGTVDTELPAAAAAADGYANPTAPSVLSHLMGYNGVTWDRIYVGQSGSLAVDLITGLDAVNDEITAYVTGTVHAIIDSGNVGLRNQLLGAQYAEDSAHVSGATGTFPLAVRQDALAALVGADGDYAPFQVDSLGRLKSRVYGSVFITGSTALADGMVNPTTAALGAHLLGYNGATWDRLYMGVSGSLAVDLVSQLDAVNDEVTAYITGTTSIEFVTGSVVGQTDGKRTYRTVFSDLSAPSGTAVALIGAAGIAVRVLQVQIAKPSVAQSPLRMAKFSTAPTGGTSTTPTPVPLDSNNPDSQATLRLYTVIPTNGTLVGSVFDADIATGDIVYETFGEQQNAQGLVLRGTGEYLSIQPSVAATLNGFVEWTEE